jgi:hypothetical protein
MLLSRFEVVVDDLAEAEGEVGENVGCRHDLAHGEIGDGRQRVWPEVKCSRPSPGAFHGHILEPVIDQLEDARAAIDVRDYFRR